MHRPLLIAALFCTAGCAKKRETAPAEMEEIARFMIANWDDERSLEDAMDNLAPWLDANMTAEDAQEGYTLGDLTVVNVDTMPRPDRALDGLLGAAVAGVSVFPITDHAGSMLLDDQVFSNPGSYDHYTRTYEGDEEAFLAGEGTVRTVSDIQTTTVGITIPYTLHKDYRWIRGVEAKPAIIARAWIPEQGCNPGGGSCLELSFSVDLFYENNASETGRFTATWSEVTSPMSGLLSDAQQVALLANGMGNVFEDVDLFLAGDLD